MHFPALNLHPSTRSRGLCSKYSKLDRYSKGTLGIQRIWIHLFLRFVLLVQLLVPFFHLLDINVSMINDSQVLVLQCLIF